MAIRPQSTPWDSPWSFRRRVAMLAWEWVWALLCWWTPKPFNPWRLLVLRTFGADLRGTPFVHARARITKPWNLRMDDRACLGDRAHAYALGPIEIGAGATVAQEVYLCTGTHDFEHPALPLVTAPVRIGADAFLGARSFVMPGVEVGERAIVGAGALVTKSVRAGTIVVGNPARVVGKRGEPAGAGA